MSTAIQLTGVIIQIDEEKQVNERFKKRDFALRVDEEYNGNTYSQFIPMQVSQTRCDWLDRYNVGDEVDVKFNLRGKRYEKDGVTRYFSTNDVWKIEKTGNTVQPAQPEVSAPAQNNHPAQGCGAGDDLPF